MSKALARSGVIRVTDIGINSSGEGSCSSHLANQFESSSLILFPTFKNNCWDSTNNLIQKFLYGKISFLFDRLKHQKKKKKKIGGSITD